MPKFVLHKKGFSLFQISMQYEGAVRGWSWREPQLKTKRNINLKLHLELTDAFVAPKTAECIISKNLSSQ